VKIFLGIFLLVNVALLMWGVGQRQFLNGSHSPATEYHPELMELLPPEESRVLAKVTINSNGVATSSNIDDKAAVKSDDSTVLSSPLSPGQAKDSDAEPASNILAEATPGQCMLIGPFKTAIQRGRSGRKLNDMSIQYSDREDPKGRVLGFRVFQGPFSSKLEVSSARRRLKKQGVKDLYLIVEGEKQRFISLGFFSSESSANSFINNFSKRQIKTKKRIEYGTNYWLLVSDLRSIRKLDEEGSVPIRGGAKKTIKPCSEIPW
jgi:hypothetical protein